MELSVFVTIKAQLNRLQKMHSEAAQLFVARIYVIVILHIQPLFQHELLWYRRALHQYHLASAEQR
jgi:hypothetical protein